MWYFCFWSRWENAGEQHGGRGKTDNGGPGLGKAVMMEGEEIKHFQNGWWPPKKLFNSLFIHRPRPSSEGCWSNRKTGESCQDFSLTNWSDKVKVDSYFLWKRWRAEFRFWPGCPSTAWSGWSPTWSLASQWASPSYLRWILETSPRLKPSISMASSIFKMHNIMLQGIAYALVAGLPPQYGLYSAYLGCFVYCLLGR